MKIEELVETVKKNKNKSLKSIINTKSYLPYTAKVDLVQDILSKCSTDYNGLTEINELDLYLVFNCDVIAAYTDIEFGILYWEDYDKLAESGLLDGVIETFADEYEVVMSLLRTERKHILSKNSIEYQTAGLVRKIEDSIDELCKSLTDKINDMDVSQFDITNSEVSELIKLIK